MASKGKKIALGSAPIALIAAIVAGLNLHEGGRRYVPYWDALGQRWTVCNGITGPDVYPGRHYTDAECNALESRFVQKMLVQMGHCVTVPLEFREIKAYGDLAYNIGTTNFCGSTITKQLNAGENAKACAQIPRWHWIGTKDCTIAANKCAGIPIRREWERQVCTGERP